MKRDDQLSLSFSVFDNSYYKTLFSFRSKVYDNINSEFSVCDQEEVTKKARYPVSIVTLHIQSNLHKFLK